MFHEAQILKYPYLGYSPHLIEYFLIIGFDKDYIKEEILPYATSQDYKSAVMPSILSSISSNYLEEMLENEQILELIFPNAPVIFTSSNPQLEPVASSVIFFLNCDTYTGQSKVPFHGYSLIFYEPINISINSTAVKLLIPKAFCVISQYPYFTFFYTLCKDILSFFGSKYNEIPIEVLLYNIVNFTPSSINSPHLHILFPYRDQLSSLSSKNLVNTSSQSSKKYQHSYFIPQLSGYPVLDFNLLEIFNILPTSMVIEIVIFNVLECDMLFYSKNLEILNFVMYIIAVLNYPCNDSIYQWHIVSVALDAFKKENCYTEKFCTTMLGVNCTYDSKFEHFNSKQFHFAIDLDNKVIHFKYNKSTKEISKVLALQAYLRRIFCGKLVTSVFLEKYVKKLMKELDVISLQVIHSNYCSKKFINFLESGEKITVMNKYVQELFYDFMLNTLSVFYNKYSLNSKFDIGLRDNRGQNPNPSSFFIRLSEDYHNFAEEEVFFCELFKGSNKYGNYILNFIQNFNSIPLYKVPLLFSEEFIYAKKFDSKGYLKSHFFDIIERFYSNTTSGILTKPPVVIDFDSFFKFYEANFKSKIIQDASQSNAMRMRQGSSLGKIRQYFDYDCIDLDANILFKYMHLLNNLPDDQKEGLFPSIGIQKSNEIRFIQASDIENTIERSLISQKIIKHDHLILYSLLIVFGITMNMRECSESTGYTCQILEMLNTRTFFIRKYISILLTIFCRIVSTSENGDKRSMGITCNFLILNFLRSQNILPNEQMMQLFENCIMNNYIIPDDFIINNLHSEEVISKLRKFSLSVISNSCQQCQHGSKKDDGFFIRLSENNDYEGNLFIECEKCTSTETTPYLVFHFTFDTAPDEIITEIYSPLKIYNTCHKILNVYLGSFELEEIDIGMLKKIVVNLIFYARKMNLTYEFLLSGLLEKNI